MNPPNDGHPPTPALRIPQPLYYFPRSDERLPRAVRAAPAACRRLAGRSVPLLGSMFVHAAGVCIAVAAVRSAGLQVAGREAAVADVEPATSVWTDVTGPGASPAVTGLPPWAAETTKPDPRGRASDAQDTLTEFLRTEASPVPGAIGDGVADTPPTGTRARNLGVDDVAGRPDDLPPYICGGCSVGERPGRARPCPNPPATAPAAAVPFPVPRRPIVARRGVPAVSFCGLTTYGPRRVTYLCDMSGSMVSKMASLKGELSASIARLEPDQSFNVVFMGNASGDVVSRTGLVPATPGNKRLAYRLMDDVTTSGASSPEPALSLALRQRPDLIYLLTDGDYPDNNAVLSTVRKLNADKKVRISTIALLNAQDTDTAFLALLKTIAGENGGQFRLVDEQSLNQ